MTVFALVGALCCVLVAPAVAASRAGSDSNPNDLPVRLAYAFGGVGVASVSIWIAGWVWEVNAWTVVGAPLALSGLLLSLRSGWVGRPTLGPPVIWIAALVIGVLVLVPFLPYGRVSADGVHRMAMSDWYKHLMLTTVLEGGTFPPPNPFLAAVSTAPYYYGFHLVVAAIEIAARSTATFWLLLGFTVLTAAAYPVVLFVVARDLFSDTRRAVTAAIGGTFLAGFDIAVWLIHAVRDTASAWPLPTGLAGLRAAVPMTSIDFWIHHNERQFTGPYVTAIWAPHHLAAVLLSLLVIREMCLVGPSSRRRLLPVIILTSIPAVSVYVAVALFVGVGVAVLTDAWIVRRPPWAVDSCRRWAQVGVPALALSLPVLFVLAASRSPLEIGISSAGTFLNGAIFTALLGDGVVARLLDTPVLYLVEFGIVGLLGAIGIVGRKKCRTLSSPQRTLAIIAAGVIVFVTLVRPPVDGPNNLYARPMLLVWSILACFAADAWHAVPRVGWCRVVGVVLGVIGTAVTIVGVTVEAVFWTTPPDTVAALRWINASTPRQTVVAYDPEQGRHGYWLRRPVVIDDRRLALLFGATDAEYDSVVGRLQDAYNASSPAAAASRFDQLGADVIVVGAPSPAWARQPCFITGYESPSIGVVTRNPESCVGRSE